MGPLPLPGVFAVPLAQVNRLERFAMRDVSTSGKMPVVIYRERIVPLLDCSRLLSDAPAPEGEVLASEDICTLIFENEGNYCAFVVNRILDIAVSNDAVDGLVRQRSGVAGNIVIGDRLVTVLDFGSLARVGMPRPVTAA